MKEALAAQGLLIEYMEARWMRDTLEPILKRYHRGFIAEAKYLIFHDLQYLDPNTYGIIMGGIGSNAAARLLGAQYASEVSKMEQSKEKLMRHDLVEVTTVGQMKTLIQLKRECCKWDFTINIGWEVEKIGFGVEGYHEGEGHIRELARSSKIPVLKPQQVVDVQTTFSPRTSDEITRDETLRLEENNTKAAAMEEDGDGSYADWEEDIEADAPKENIAAIEEEEEEEEEDDDDDMDCEEVIEADAPKVNIAAMEELEEEDDIVWEEDTEAADAPKENIAAMEEEEDDDEDIDWEES